jgi:hypothetical protein
MERTTIMLPSNLMVKAQKRANDMGMSLNQYIREAVENSLKLQQREQSIEEDSLFADAAVFVGKGPSDMAENHDRNLYGETE